MIEKLVKDIQEKQGKGPVGFIESFLTFRGKPFRLFTFQKRIAEESNFLHEKIVIRKARQVGGSLLVAALVVFYVACHPYSTVIILSKTKDQAGLISGYVREFFASSNLLGFLIDQSKTTTLDLYLVNKSKVITRSAGQVKGDTLRGHTIGGQGFICFDESSFIPADAIRNTYYAAAGNCGIVHCSTPYRPVGAFYDASKSKRFREFYIPAKLSPRITADDLAFWREDMSASKYANEVDAEFSQGEDAVFNPIDIDWAIDMTLPRFGEPMKGNPERNYYYSLDVSRIGSDRWVLFIGELDRENVMTIRGFSSWAGTIHADRDMDDVTLTDNPDSILADIARFQKEHDFHCLKCYVDTTSNEYFAHTLAKRYGFPVEHVIWNMSKKERMVSHLDTCFKSRKIKIPNSDIIRRELLAYSYDWKRMQDHEERKLYLSNEEDDHVSALVMLAQAVTLGTQQYKDRLIWR